MALFSTGTSSDRLSAGTTAQRPTLALADAGSIRFNKTLGTFEQWDGTKWGPLGGSVAISPNAPTNPNEGDLWYNTNDSRLYAAVDDVSGSPVWVDASPDSQNAYWDRDETNKVLSPASSSDLVSVNASAAETAAVVANNPDVKLYVNGDATMTSQNDGPLAGFRNQLINGGFNNWQRGASFTVTSSTEYTADRWGCNTGTGLTSTASISVAAPVAAGLQYAIKNTGSVGVAIQQPVELQRTASNMQFYVGSQWTLSFWSTQDQTSNAVNVKFKVGTLDTGALPVSSTLPNFQSTGETADGYTRYSATFTVTQNASALATCNALAVIIALGAGEQLTGCQLEPGPVATPFENRPIGTEFALCQRYFQKFDYDIASRRAAFVQNQGASAGLKEWYGVAPSSGTVMRIQRPTVSFSNMELMTEVNQTVTVNNINSNQFGATLSFSVSSGAVGNTGQIGSLRAVSNTSYIAFDAEL